MNAIIVAFDSEIESSCSIDPVKRERHIIDGVYKRLFAYGTRARLHLEYLQSRLLEYPMEGRSRYCAQRRTFQLKGRNKHQGKEVEKGEAWIKHRSLRRKGDEEEKGRDPRRRGENERSKRERSNANTAGWCTLDGGKRERDSGDGLKSDTRWLRACKREMKRGSVPLPSARRRETKINSKQSAVG